MSEVTVTLVYSGGAELQQTISDSTYNVEVKQFSDLVNGTKCLLMEQQPGNGENFRFDSLIYVEFIQVVLG